MKIGVTISASAALKAGKNESGKRIVEIDAATLTEAERMEIVCHVVNDDRYAVPGADLSVGSRLAGDMTVPTAEELLRVVRWSMVETTKKAEESEREAAKKDEERREFSASVMRKIEAARAMPPTDGIYHNGSWWVLGREVEPVWPGRWSAEDLATLDALNAPRLAECDRRNAEAETKKAHEKAEAEATKKAGLEILAGWVREHGSELARLRLDEGYDCWVSAAHDDFINSVAGVVANLMDSAEIPDGYTSKTDERKCPTAVEINKLRVVRGRCVDQPAAVSLIYMTYTPEDPDVDDEGDGTIKRTELRVTVTCPDGYEGERDYLIVE